MAQPVAMTVESPIAKIAPPPQEAEFEIVVQLAAVRVERFVK